MLTISSGHSVEYLTDAVAQGRENYYSQAVAEGEPPGQWYGRGAESLGLAGDVDADAMKHLYGRFADPRDPRFTDPETRDQAAPLPGRSAYTYASAEQAIAAALEREPEAAPERVAQIRLEAAKSARSAVAFLDVTFSVQKSVTVLHTAFEAQEVAARRAGDAERERAWAAHREAVEAAIWAGNRAGLDYLADAAGYARVGYHRPAGGGRFVDAHDWTVASFFQHTSRTDDPQLHIHNAVLNRVECPDGKWRTLDSRGIHRNRGAAAALAERTMEEHLSRTLGVRFATRPDGKAREVVGVRPEVLELFSARRRAITDRTRRLVAEFETRYGRAPSSLERDRLQRQATFLTRPGKSHTGETTEERLERWAEQLRAEVDTGLEQVARDALGHAGDAPAQRFSPSAVIETALADVQATKAAWTRSDLMRAVNAALPDSLGGLEPHQVRQVIESLTDQATRVAEGADLPGGQRSGYDVTALTFDVDAPMPPELTLANGESVYRPPAGRRFATRQQLVAERALRDAARTRGRAAVNGETANQAMARFTEATGVELGADQAAAVRGVLTSGAALEVLVGPAGAGKSRALGALAAVWADPDNWPQRVNPPRVVGLATSQLATEVLAGEGLTARNVARWLASQQRLETGRAKPEDARWRLAAGDLVVIDEASMVDTAAVAEIRRYADAAGAKLLLTGDHRQLAAIGAGGAFDLVARQAATYELAEVRRFTAEWERDASLRLRDGDLTAVADYERHGRLIDAGTAEQAGDAARMAWLADTLSGRRSLLLVDTNEQAATLSAACRADLVRLGKVVDEQTVALERDGNRAGVGDLVQARRLAPELRGWQGNTAGPVNREYYRITEITADGQVTVTPITDGQQFAAPMRLPAAYAREHLVLGYASTVHSAQGQTVDTSHTVITPSTGAAAGYVGLTRGRESNTAYVATVHTGPDAPTGEAHQAGRRTPAAVLAEVLESDEPDPAALLVAEQSKQEARSVATLGDRLAEAGELLAKARHAGIFDQLTERGLISEEHRRALAGDTAAPALSQLLRTAELAGHDAAQVLTEAVTGRPLDGSRSVAQVLHYRISEQLDGQLTPAGDTFTDRLPPAPSPAWSAYLDTLGELADERRRELSTQVAGETPQWAAEALGPVPDDPTDRQEWEHRAGIIAAHRELTGWDDQAQPIGPAPRPGAVDARASWHAAWRALGRPEASTEELELADGALRVRIRAYEREETWAPPWVGDELAATAQAQARHRQTATLAEAEAAAATDPAQAAAARQRAEQAAAMAELLTEQQRRLEAADAARGKWYAHTAATRQAAHRARAELARRGAAIEDADDAVTAEEWLAIQAEAQRAEDPYRTVGPEDLAEVAQARDADVAAAFRDVDPGDDQAHAPASDQPARASLPPEAAPTVAEPASLPAGVPTLAATAAQVLRAQAALTELADRTDLEQRRQADQQAEELAAAQLATDRSRTAAHDRTRRHDDAVTIHG